MKTLLTLLSIVTMQTAISQSLDSALAFYPLHLGDTWTYDFRIGYNPSVHGWYYSVTVVGDTTIPSGVTYTVLRQLDSIYTTNQYVRVDSSTGCVYSPTNFETWAEYMSDSLLAQKGDRSGVDRCWDVYQDTVLGFPTIVKYLIHQPFWSHALAYGLGTIYQYSGNSLRGVVETILVYARIAGREYGIPVSVLQKSPLPAGFNLGQNYPNPFNPSTTIEYQLASRSDVTLKIYNVLGQEVATLVDQIQDAGRYHTKFSAAKFSNGVYFYRLNAGKFRETKKLILLK